MTAHFDPKKFLQNIGKGNSPRWYLSTEARIVWFRAVFPPPVGSIVVSYDKDSQLVYASVFVGDVELGRDMATMRDGQGTTWQGRELEKASTAAIGRALKNAGFGTMSAIVAAGVEGDSDDADEDSDYLPDAPVDAPAQPAQPKGTQRQRGQSPYAATAQSGFNLDKQQGELILKSKQAHPGRDTEVVNTVLKMANEGAFNGVTNMAQALGMVAERLATH